MPPDSFSSVKEPRVETRKANMPIRLTSYISIKIPLTSCSFKFTNSTFFSVIYLLSLWLLSHDIDSVRILGGACEPLAKLWKFVPFARGVDSTCHFPFVYIVQQNLHQLTYMWP